VIPEPPARSTGLLWTQKRPAWGWPGALHYGGAATEEETSQVNLKAQG
jgi:hypothetical protein